MDKQEVIKESTATKGWKKAKYIEKRGLRHHAMLDSGGSLMCERCVSEIDYEHLFKRGAPPRMFEEAMIAYTKEEHDKIVKKLEKLKKIKEILGEE